MNYLTKLKELESKATPGRWWVGLHFCSSRYTVLNCAETIHRIDRTAENVNAADAAFIAESRTAVPKLLEALEVAMEGLEKHKRQTKVSTTCDCGKCHDCWSRQTLTRIDAILDGGEK